MLRSDLLRSVSGSETQHDDRAKNSEASAPDPDDATVLLTLRHICSVYSEQNRLRRMVWREVL